MGYTSSIDSTLEVFGVIPKDLVNELNADPEISFWFSFEEESVYANGESGKAYNLTETIKRMAIAVRKSGLADLDGDVVVYGEEPGDIWRIILEGGTLTVQEADIVWSGKSNTEQLP